jgi:putative transposase
MEAGRDVKECPPLSQATVRLAQDSHRARKSLNPFNCWDNAVAESFFATLKNELVYRRTWRNRIELRRALFEYIEVFYNRRRLHSSNGYKTPDAVEQSYFAAQAAA